MAAAIEVPERFNAATHFLDRHVREGRSARIAFRFEGRDVTYGAIALRANRLGHALLARDLQIEQRVSKPSRYELARRGHVVEVEPEWSEGRLTAAAKDGPRRKAAANPRGMQGYAAGR